MTDYMYKRDPLEHQHEVFMKTRDEEQHALLLEMGLGKTKIVIDTAAWQFAQGVIDFLLIIAPSGVHTNWITDEIPKDMPEWTNCKYAEWGSQMKKAQAAKVEELFDGYTDRTSLRVLAMNIEAFGVAEPYYKKKAGALAMSILNTFNVMMIVDESSFIKNAGANRTRRLITLSKHAKARRILNGTPVTQGPLDLYSQYKFIAGPGAPLLGPYSMNKRSFENHYAEWEEQQRQDGQRYKTLVGYRHMDELTGYVDQCSTRLTKAECLNLPPKLYSKIRVEMHKEQKRLYKKAETEGLLELGAGGEVTLDNVLVLWLRLQQIVGGFIPVDDVDPTYGEKKVTQCILDDYQDLPRFQEFAQRIDQVQSGKVIIICRFLAEVKMWRDHYGDKAVTYVGKAHYKDPDTRNENKRRFQEDDSVQIMIGNRSMARGLTLTACQSMFFYSNTFSLDDRLQTEDRAHRIGQTNPVSYYDGYSEGTIDVKLVQAYRTKKELADIITKDNPTSWV